MKKYYAEIIGGGQTIVSKKYDSSKALLEAFASCTDKLVDKELKFYNIEYKEDGTQLLHNGL